MSATIATLPIWKRNSTAAEWLEELAGLARENPERWERIVVVLQEGGPDAARHHIRNYSRGVQTNQELLGLLTAGQLELFEYMKGRRD